MFVWWKIENDIEIGSNTMNEKKNLVFLWCKNQRRIVLLERITENRKKGSHNINAFLRLSWFLPLFSQLRHLFSFWNFHSNSGKSSFLLYFPFIFPLYNMYANSRYIGNLVGRVVMDSSTLCMWLGAQFPILAYGENSTGRE
jgi:hypothetical protein